MTLQQRMSALNPGCPWRGVLVVAGDSGFNSNNRAAADYMYSLAGGPPPSSDNSLPTYFICNMGRMMGRRA